MQRDATGSEIVLACVDPWGRRITLSGARWREHILVEHAELAQHLAAIEATLTGPTFLMRDRRRSDRENSYRPNVLPAPLDHLYLKVVVEFPPTVPEASTSGIVITAYPIPGVTIGEAQLWP